MAITWKKLAYEADCLLLSSFDAKGDLLSASADNTLAVLSVGTNNKALVADSAEASGLKWSFPTPAGHELTDHDSAGQNGNYVRINVSSSTPEYVTKADLAGDLALDNIGVPDAAVDFDLQQATDLVFMTVANEAGLPTTGIAVGQVCFATTELSLHICTAIA